MDIKTIVVGPLEVNCYLLHEGIGGPGIVIDPGDDAEIILEMIDELGVNLKHIVNTHGHFDHVGGNRKLKEKTGASISIHNNDVELLKHAGSSAAQFGLRVDTPPEPDIILIDGQTIEAGKIRLNVLHTPGHSPGGISLFADSALFTGDTLFAGSIGRTDLPGGSSEQLIESVRTRLFTLDDGCIVYPGHGPKSSVGYEKANNPFFCT